MLKSMRSFNIFAPTGSRISVDQHRRRGFFRLTEIAGAKDRRNRRNR
jgi:hypothetical protein